jgi:hypothetical protein
MALPNPHHYPVSFAQYSDHFLVAYHAAGDNMFSGKVFFHMQPIIPQNNPFQ